MLIATGKNVRYAAMIATAFQPAMPFDPSPTTTIGAIARIGTVCDATMYGRMPRSSRRDCDERDREQEADRGAEQEAGDRLLHR